MSANRSSFGVAGMTGMVVMGAAGLWLIGVAWTRAIVVALPLAAAMVLVRRLGGRPGGDAAWPGPPNPGPACAGWHHVAMLGSVLHAASGDRERYRAVIAPRLRALAETRLRERGVRWDEPEARQLLGPDVHALLSGQVDRPPTMAMIAAALDRIDGLAPVSGRLTPATGAAPSVSASAPSALPAASASAAAASLRGDASVSAAPAPTGASAPAP